MADVAKEEGLGRAPTPGNMSAIGYPTTLARSALTCKAGAGHLANHNAAFHALQVTEIDMT